MITIHTNLSTSEDITNANLVVRSPEHYPMIRRQIQEALTKNGDLEVFILTHVCDNWFWDLLDYRDDVILINDAPVERLKRKLAINALPSDLVENPNLIIELDLLDLPNPIEKVGNVWTWITQYKLGEVWIAKEPSQEHFSKLVNWYVENTVNPLLQSKIDRITQIWIDTAFGKLRSAYIRFFEDPHRNAYSLITWSALSSYDHELREQWLASQGWFSRKMEDLAEMIEAPTFLPKPIRNKLNLKISTHWNTLLKERFND